MQKMIELEDGNKIRIIYEDGINLIQKGYIDDNGVIKTIEFSRHGDYCFEGYSIYDDNKIDFEFNKNDPLYNHLERLLRGENELIIDDDLTRESNKKIMRIYKQQDKIIISIENYLLGVSIVDKLNICVINVAYDQRSKIEQQNLDTKERLNEFFNNIYINFLEELDPQKVKK